MTDQSDSTKSVNYTYDLLGRLKTAQTPSAWSVKETYDRYGNRWQQDRVGNSTTAPTSGSTTVTLDGFEQSQTNEVCDLYDEGGSCVHYSNQTTYDSGSVNVTVGGYTATVFYDSGSTNTNLATALANAFSGDPSSPVTASHSGSTVTLTAKDVGPSSNYVVSTSASTDDPGDFGGPSYTASGSNLSGGSAGSLGTGGSGPQSNLSFDLSNHIGSTGYSYDNAGNLTADGTFTYIYDGENRLTQVSSSGLGTATYTYNAGDRRVRKSYSSVTTNYVYEGDKILAEQEGSTWHDYVYLGSRLIADVTSSSTTYHHSDRTSTRMTTDSSANILSTQQTAPFGEVQSDSSSSATKRKFTSYDRDPESGNDFAVNREYVSTTGRFTQPDPLGIKAVSLAKPQSLNAYNYVNNDPINFMDPSGLMTICVYLDLYLTDKEHGTSTPIGSILLYCYMVENYNGNGVYGEIGGTPGAYNPQPNTSTISPEKAKEVIAAAEKDLRECLSDREQEVADLLDVGHKIKENLKGVEKTMLLVHIIDGVFDALLEAKHPLLMAGVAVEKAGVITLSTLIQNDLNEEAVDSAIKEKIGEVRKRAGEECYGRFGATMKANGIGSRVSEKSPDNR